MAFSERYDILLNADIKVASEIKTNGELSIRLFWQNIFNNISSDHGSVKNKEQGVVAAGEAGGRGGRCGGRLEVRGNGEQHHN